ncbi:MAG: hypothetical protein DRQ56_07195, partial [Gammaproteobacteria bacterium]
LIIGRGNNMEGNTEASLTERQQYWLKHIRACDAAYINGDRPRFPKRLGDARRQLLGDLRQMKH